MISLLSLRSNTLTLFLFHLFQHSSAIASATVPFAVSGSTQVSKSSQVSPEGPQYWISPVSVTCSDAAHWITYVHSPQIGVGAGVGVEPVCFFAGSGAGVEAVA